jgi:phosphatidylserine/phosphatidylglycerophosphate/cardiolipin synthase-like enzyme
MPTVELSETHVVDLVKQLPPDKQRAALLALAEGAAQRCEDRMQFAEAQLRRLAADRGLDWDKLSEEAREAFVDELLHEDRSLGCESTIRYHARW